MAMSPNAVDYNYWGNDPQMAREQLGYQAAKDSASQQNQYKLGQMGQEEAAAAQQGAANRESQERIANRPLEYKQGIFNTVWPTLQGQLGWLHNQFGGGQPFAPPPPIDTSPVLSQNQIQQQVNNSAANVNQKAAGTTRDLGQQMAGRGFGGNSAMLAALGGQQQAAAMGTNASNESQTRIAGAEKNATHVLNAQTAEGQQENAYQEAVTNRIKPYFNTYGTLLGTLGSLI